jgi:hypothetical protein
MRVHLAGSFAAAAAVVALSASLRCQATPDRVLVLAHATAPVRAVLLEVDPANGAVVPLPSFPSDAAVPLALAVDPATREPIVALQLPAGSVIVRVHLVGQQVTGESVLGIVPGTVVALTVPSTGDVYAAVGGAAGGIVRVARHCCGASAFWTAPGITALSDPVIAPWKFWAASVSGAAPRIDSFVDDTGPSGETYPLPSIGSAITGVHEWLAGTRTRLLVDANGTMYRQTLATGVGSYVVSPPLAAGGAIRMKAGPHPRIYVLGGAADPTLKWFPIVSASAVPPLTVLAPIAPTPVDFAVVAPANARAVPFGEPCAAPPGGAIAATGVPQLGNASFEVRLTDGLPGALAVCALGWSERSFLGVPLPLPLGACRLLVSADVVTAHVTDATGAGSRALPVPAVPALAGQIVYAQWGQDLAALRTSGALALHLF